MEPVGYLTYGQQGLQGTRGLYYDYVLTGQGIYIEAEGEFMAARVPIAAAEIRGLGQLSPMVVLRHGKIPQRFFDLALNHFLANRHREVYIAVAYDLLKQGYSLVIPPQAENNEQLQQEGDQGYGSSTGVTYVTPEKIVLELHSHGEMLAGFSLQDNRDEQGMKIYGVVGSLMDEPHVNLRVGLYGYFMNVLWTDIFEGQLIAAKDVGEFDIPMELEYGL